MDDYLSQGLFTSMERVRIKIDGMHNVMALNASGNYKRVKYAFVEKNYLLKRTAQKKNCRKLHSTYYFKTAFMMIMRRKKKKK